MKNHKKNVLHRLKITRGHLDKVINMVNEDEYCIETVHQSIAVQAALKKIDKIILKHHMNTCVAEKIRKGQKNDAVDEVMMVMEKM